MGKNAKHRDLVFLESVAVAARARGQALLGAIGALDEAGLLRALEAGSSASSFEGAGNGSQTPLTMCARMDWPEGMRILAAAGARLDQANPSSFMPLHEAAKQGSLLAMREALALGADVEQLNAKGRTALFCAARSCSDKAVAELIGLGAAVEPSHEHWQPALAGAFDLADHVELGGGERSAPRAEAVLKSLLGAGMEPVEREEPEGFTLLLLAIRRGLAGAAADLIGAGALRPEWSSLRREAMLSALDSKCMRCVELAHGADPILALDCASPAGSFAEAMEFWGEWAAGAQSRAPEMSAWILGARQARIDREAVAGASEPSLGGAAARASTKARV